MACPRLRGDSDQRGAVLLMLLVTVTLLGLLAGIAGTSWQTIVQRGREADLLWKGSQIRQAIDSYYNTSQTQGKGAALKAFPGQLEDLLQDPRFLEVKRHLRRLYLDPMTGGEWELIRAPGGGIMGVCSTSVKKPFRQDGFSDENKSFAGQQSYRNWKFIYTPAKASTSGNTSTGTNRKTATED